MTASSFAGSSIDAVFNSVGYLRPHQLRRVCYMGKRHPGPRIHSKDMHGFPKIHGYQHGYPWYLDASIQLSIQAWISTLISKHGYPCKDIPQRISLNKKYPYMDIHVLWILVFSYSCFMDVHLDILGFLWISMHWLAIDPRSSERKT